MEQNVLARFKKKEKNVLEQILEGSMKPAHIPLGTLWEITDGFSPDRIIGEGGFATVYKGIVKHWSVAVKRISSNMTIDDKLFHREVDSLMEVNHPNIVRFLGFCSHTVEIAMEKPEGRGYIYAEKRERLLCFEYINTGSLDKKITDELRGLEWDTRYQIIRGICTGLHHLHVEKHILHMDLKPANILLVDGMVPKITDFGLSRPIECSQTMTGNHYATLGYCAPENMFGGRLTTTSDMYSLGAIIVELVTGHKGIPDYNFILRRWRHRWNQSAKEMIPEYHQQVTKCIEIGSLCGEIDPFVRPSISKVMKILEIGSMDNHDGNAYESTVGQINSPGYWEDDMLGVEPLELQFGYNKQKQILSCSIELSNDTNGFIAYKIGTTSPLPYSIEPIKEIVKPQSKYRVDFSLPIANTHDHAAARQYSNKLHDKFILRSIKVNEGLKIHDISEDMLDKNSMGHHVDEIHLAVVCEEQCSKEAYIQDKVVIPKVRPRLRRVDEDAFTPHSVLIGLYNYRRGVSEWAEMKEQAVRHVLFRDENGELMRELQNLESEARRCYTHVPDQVLSSKQFSNMLLRDGCYLLCLFIMYSESDNSVPQDPVTAAGIVSHFWVVRDTVFLLENQIPLFVLQKIHEHITGGTSQSTVLESIADSVQCLLQAKLYISKKLRRAPPQASHLLHLLHSLVLPANPTKVMEENTARRDRPLEGRWRRATEYHCHNVRFKCKDFVDGVESSILDVNYQEGTLWIPCLLVDSNMWTILRNLMALEEQMPQQPVTAYCLFLSQVAGTVEDVKLLIGARILQHVLASDKQVAEGFANLRKGVVLEVDNLEENYLTPIWHALDTRCNNWVNRFVGKCKNIF